MYRRSPSTVNGHTLHNEYQLLDGNSPYDGSQHCNFCITISQNTIESLAHTHTVSIVRAVNVQRRRQTRVLFTFTRHNDLFAFVHFLFQSMNAVCYGIFIETKRETEVTKNARDAADPNLRNAQVILCEKKKTNKQIKHRIDAKSANCEFSKIFAAFSPTVACRQTEVWHRN